MDGLLSFEAWLADPRNDMADDPVWRLTAFKRAMYSADISWVDVCALARRPVTATIASQLYRAVGSIGANLTEGCSRSSGRDRARMFEYSLGSARESIVWYGHARPVLGDHVVELRQDSLQHVVRLLTTMIPHERRRNV